MIIRNWKKPEVVVLTVTVACVKNHVPLIGFSEDVEKAWRSLVRKHKLKKREINPLVKTASTTEVETKPKDKGSINEGTPIERSSTASDIGRVMLKFRQMEKDEEIGRQEDVYSKNYVPKKYSRASEEYGTPKPGTLTEKRAKKASKHIAREMLYLCEMIQQYGHISKRTGNIQITFGKLFDVYQFISDKVVGMLLRARKHKMVEFEGEMLFQRRDEEVVITLLLTPDEIQNGIDNL